MSLCCPRCEAGPRDCKCDDYVSATSTSKDSIQCAECRKELKSISMSVVIKNKTYHMECYEKKLRR